MRIVSLYSVGLVERMIAGDIVHNIRVVDRRSTVLMRHRQWGILEKVVLEFMYHWIKGRQITKSLLSRWTVRFMIKLFLF